uniref:Uncharacterized protein n=1 Tax=Anopheles dirus TaxID=7168 RepID=A0A182NWD9_9DIPT
SSSSSSSTVRADHQSSGRCKRCPYCKFPVRVRRRSQNRSRPLFAELSENGWHYVLWLSAASEAKSVE